MRPQVRQTFKEWAAENLPGYSWAQTPYFVAIAEDIDNPAIEEITVIKSAQIGFTYFLAAVLAYWGATYAANTLLVLPTDEKADKEQKVKFNPWISSAPGVVRLKRKRHILYNRGGNLFLSSSEKSSALKSDTCRFLAGDEIDEFPFNVQGEGDPIKMAMARQITQKGIKSIWGSTPRHADGHVAARDKAATDKRDFYFACPHCNVYQKPAFKQLRWLKFPGKTHKETAAEISAKPSLVTYKCQANGCRITEAKKAQMVAGGLWVSQTQKIENGVVVGSRPIGNKVSYRLSSIISLWFSWAKLCIGWLEAVDDPNEKKTFLSQYLGRLPEVRVVQPVISGGLTRTQKEAAIATGIEGIVPAWASLLVMGTDVQADRCYWILRAFGSVRSQLVKAGVCGSEKELLPIMAAQFPISGSLLTMPVSGMAIDFGGAQNEKTKVTAKKRIFEFAGSNPLIMPVKGHANKSDKDFIAKADETYNRLCLTLHSIRIADRIFTLRDAGLWGLFSGVNSSYIDSIDGVIPTLSETGVPGYQYRDRCDHWDAEVYAYVLFKYLASLTQIPEESVVERLRSQVSTAGNTTTVTDAINQASGSSIPKNW